MGLEEEKMAATTKKTRNTSINPARLTEELRSAVSVPLLGVGYHGHDPVTDRLSTLRTSPRLVTRRRDASGTTEDFAAIGEMRLRTDAILSGADDAAVDAVLSAHDETQLTQEQRREDKDTATLNATAARLRFATWDALTPAQKIETLRRCCQLLFRDQRFAGLDTDD